MAQKVNESAAAGSAVGMHGGQPAQEHPRADQVLPPSPPHRSPPFFLLLSSARPQHAVRVSDIQRYRLDRTTVAEIGQKHFVERVIHGGI